VETLLIAGILPEMRQPDSHSKWWWTVPLAFILILAGSAVAVCLSSEIAREVVTKAVFNIVGAVSTPFILETTVAIVGLSIVLAYNHYRVHKDGDGWVYLAVTEPDAASVAAGATTPPHRLDGVVLTEKPEFPDDLDSRLAVVEGFLELGLRKEALDHLALLTARERCLPKVEALLQAAQPGVA
jgi:hypothetical protein